MTVSINNANAMAQLKYDQSNAANDVKKLNQIKQQADAAPDKKLTADQAGQVLTALTNLQNNQAQVQSDLRGLQANGQGDQVAHAADYMNALNNAAQQAGLGLESGNDLDDALTAAGTSSTVFHNLLDQANAANSGNLNLANASGGGGDADNAGAVQSANTDSASADSSVDPYSSHNAAPEGVADLYSASAQDRSVAGGAHQGASENVAQDITSGNPDQAFKDLQFGYATYLSVTRTEATPAALKFYADLVKNDVLAKPGLTEDHKATLDQVMQRFTS